MCGDEAKMEDVEMEDIEMEDIPKSIGLCEIIALRTVRIGTDPINFKILEMLPSNIGIIMKEFDLTKVPVNVRVNQLEKVGLVRRFKGTGHVEITDFGQFFLNKIITYEDIVAENIIHILKRL